jgi:hypothetical protein
MRIGLDRLTRFARPAGHSPLAAFGALTLLLTLASACSSSTDASVFADPSTSGADATASADGSNGGNDDAATKPSGDDASTSGSDAGAGDDATTTTTPTPSDAGPTTKPPPRDAGPTTTPPPMDAGPTGLRYACGNGGATTTDCASGCAGNPLPCVLCGPGGPTDVQAVCVPQGSACLSTYGKPGYGWCKCSGGDPSACVIPEQECNPYNGGVCVTCGENLTNGYSCKSGGRCNQAKATCG